MSRKLMTMLLIVVCVLSLVVTSGAKVPLVEESVPFYGDLDGNKLSDDLDDLLAKTSPGEKISVIVVLDRAPLDEVLQDLSLGVAELKGRWEHAIHGFSVDMTPGRIRAMARHPFIQRIDLERTYHALGLGSATTWTGVQAARSTYAVCGDRDGNKLTYSKNDVVIAILDTGIHVGHVDLDAGKVIGWFDAINGNAAAYDDQGHGTHVAGIAAGTGEGNNVDIGVAPGAALVGIKVLNRQGSGTTTQIINGINWMINNRATFNIRIGNMSLGSSGSSDGTDSLSQAVNNAVNNGIIMVVAGGNSGPALRTTGSPAAAANAITVGALHAPGDRGWALAAFSGRGPTADNRTKPNVTAPGTNINAPAHTSSTGYVSKSGTSMAAPFLAGVIGLMLDANNSLTDSGVKDILYAPANVRDLGPSGMDNDFGQGANLSFNSIKQAGGFTTGSFSDNLTIDFGSGTLSGTGATQNHTFSVTATTAPIAITFIHSNWSTSVDFDIRLLNPSGTQVASSTGTNRQETIRFQPSVTGTYTLRVNSYAGSGNYWFNVSRR
ncbi:MAG: peptidase S8 and S53 subtilisin kexin sedolisin [Bacillota bacterium]|nr:MAG: peptidase S8 and S53 subtilisin kexin sedolisin [Bacillota bacterium]